MRSMMEGRRRTDQNSGARRRRSRRPSTAVSAVPLPGFAGEDKRQGVTPRDSERWNGMVSSQSPPVASWDGP